MGPTPCTLEPTPIMNAQSSHNSRNRNTLNVVCAKYRRQTRKQPSLSRPTLFHPLLLIPSANTSITYMVILRSIAGFIIIMRSLQSHFVISFVFVAILYYCVCFHIKLYFCQSHHCVHSTFFVRSPHTLRVGSLRSIV